MSVAVRTENIQTGNKLSRLQKHLWELPFYHVQNGTEGCFPPLSGAHSLHSAYREVEKHLIQNKTFSSIPDILGEESMRYGAGWPTQTAFDVLEGSETQFPIQRQVIDIYGASTVQGYGSGKRLDYIIPINDSAVCIPFSTDGSTTSQLGDLMIALPKGDVRPELANLTQTIMGLYAGLSSITGHIARITSQQNIHPQEKQLLVDRIAEGQYIPTLRQFIVSVNTLMNSTSIRFEDGIFTPLSGEDQLSMRYVNSLLVAQALLLFPWSSVKEPSLLPSDMIKKIHTISKDKYPEWGHHLAVDECQVLAEQNIHLGHTFQEQLYEGVRQRIGARFNAIEKNGKPDSDALMPLVIEVGENGLHTDPESVRKANALIWSALNSVCQDLGIPFERSMWWNFHPDVDNGLFIIDIHDAIYKGESVLAHEVKHLLTPAEQGRRFMVLDFFLEKGRSSGQTELTWATATAISDKNRKDGPTIETFLAPLYPSRTDIEYALGIDADKAMNIIRQKPYYHLLTSYYKNLVEQRFKSDGEWVGCVLNNAQDNIMGLNETDVYIDTHKIKYRKYPWEDRLDTSIPITSGFSVSINL